MEYEGDSDSSADASTQHEDSTDLILEESSGNNSETQYSSTEEHVKLLELRELLPLKSNINFEGCDDEMLLRFLRARKHNVDNAFKLLCSCFEFNSNNPELLNGLNASELRYILEDGFPCILPYEDSDGSTFMVLLPGLWDTATFTVKDILQALMLSFEHLCESESVQLNGIVLLVDFSGWTTAHAACLNLGYIRKIVTIFQDCYPLYYRAIHLINQPWYINALISLMRPFLEDNVKDRVYLHGNNLATLHKHIPPENLPAELGGDRPEVDQSYWARVLLRSEKQAARLQRKESVVRIGKNPFRRTSVVVTGVPKAKQLEEAEPLLPDEWCCIDDPVI